MACIKVQNFDSTKINMFTVPRFYCTSFIFITGFAKLQFGGVTRVVV